VKLFFVVCLPIVTGSRRGDTDEEAVKVKLPQTGVGLPANALKMRSLGLSNLDIGPALSNGTDLGRELCVETHDVHLLSPKTGRIIEVTKVKSEGWFRNAQPGTVLGSRVYKLLTCRVGLNAAGLDRLTMLDASYICIPACVILSRIGSLAPELRSSGPVKCVWRVVWHFARMSPRMG
jgi:hypothetical protein